MELQTLKRDQAREVTREGDTHQTGIEGPRPALNPVQLFLEDDEENSDEEYFPDGGWKAWLVVFGSFIGLVINFGFLNAIGAVQAYVSNHQLAGQKVSSVSWVFSIYMCLPFFLGAFVGPIFDSRGATMLLTALTIMLFGGFIAVSFSKLIVAFIFSLSFCMGIAQALAITPLVSLISHWFNLHRGKALGVATLGGSVGGVVWPLVLQAFYGSVGFGWGIRIVGFICLFGSSCLVLLVKSRFKRQISLSSKSGLAKFLLTTKSFFDLLAFKEPKFTFLVAGVFFTEIALMSILTYLASYAILYGMSERDSLYLLTIFNAAGAFGRFIPNALADKIGTFNVMVSMLVGFVFLIFVIWLPFGHITAGLYAFTVTCGFFSSSILGLTPLCLGAITRVNQFGQRYGLMYTFSSTGILFGVPVGAAIIGEGHSLQYRNFAVFCGCFATVGTLCWLTSRWFLVGLKVNVKV